MTIDFDKFYRITRYDISAFFSSCIDFFSNDYQVIVNYYDGGEQAESAFASLNTLLSEVSKIEPLFIMHQSRLDTFDMWEILDLFTDMQCRLFTALKTGKWKRSSRLNTNDSQVKIPRIQKEHETIEDIARSLGYEDPQNQWADILVDNRTIEEDYTPDGGKLFTIKFKNNASFTLPNIVDYLTGQNVLGKDINRKISFIDNDLDIVEYGDAMSQSLNIKMNARKNSIPEFPELGIPDDGIGSNIASITYPSIYRGLASLFRRDKRWSEFNLIDIYRVDDAIYMKFEIKAISGNEFITNVKI